MPTIPNCPCCQGGDCPWCTCTPQTIQVIFTGISFCCVTLRSRFNILPTGDPCSGPYVENACLTSARYLGIFNNTYNLTYVGELATNHCVWCGTGPTVFYAESPCVSDNCATINAGPSSVATPIVYLYRHPTTGATGWSIELLAQCNGGANGPFFDLFFLSTNILTSMNDCTTGGLVGLNTYTAGHCGNSFSCLDEFCGLNAGVFPSYIMGRSGSVTINPGSCL